MNDIIVLGLAAIGGVSIFYSFVTIGGAIVAAIGCGIIGIIIGLLFLDESAAGFTLICAALGLVGGAVDGPRKMLKMTHDGMTHGESYYDSQLTQIETSTLVITLMLAGLIGAFIVGVTSAGDALRVIAGYGAGTVVGIAVWRVIRDTLESLLENLACNKMHSRHEITQFLIAMNL